MKKRTLMIVILVMVSALSLAIPYVQHANDEKRQKESDQTARQLKNEAAGYLSEFIRAVEIGDSATISAMCAGNPENYLEFQRLSMKHVDQSVLGETINTDQSVHTYIVKFEDKGSDPLPLARNFSSKNGYYFMTVDIVKDRAGQNGVWRVGTLTSRYWF